jgi:hypothetical protein
VAPPPPPASGTAAAFLCGDQVPLHPVPPCPRAPCPRAPGPCLSALRPCRTPRAGTPKISTLGYRGR